MKDYYALFGLHPTSTLSEIQVAYKQIRNQIENQRGDSKDNDSSINAQLLELDEGYAILSEPGQRAAYDRLHESQNKEISTALVQQSTQLGIDTVVPVNSPINCPHCSTLNPVRAVNCLKCGKQITRPCPQCGQNLSLQQTVCTRCETILSEYDMQRFAEGAVIEQRVSEERIKSEARVTALEERHSEARQSAVIFWLLIMGLCLVLPLIALLFSNIFGWFLR